MKPNFFISYQNWRSNNAQIATFFTLMIAVMFLFVVVTINISKTADVKTAVSKAADSSALLLATYFGSYARSLYEALPDPAEVDGFGTGTRNSDTEYCDWDWLLIFAIIMVALAIVTGGASLASTVHPVWMVIAIVGVAASAYNLYNYLRDRNSALNAANRRMRSLPIKDQFREMAIVKALSQMVTDTMVVRDNFDLDEDGLKDDGISRFDAWYYERMLNLLTLERGSEIHIALDQLRSVLMDLYRGLQGESDDAYTLSYLDEESTANMGPDFPDCTGDSTNACYLDEYGEDFISLLYELKNKGIQVSSSVNVEGESDNGDSVSYYPLDWWVSPKIPPQTETDDDGNTTVGKWVENGDEVDGLLFWLRGYLGNEYDGLMGFLRTISSLSVAQMQDAIGSWYPYLDDDLCYDDTVKGYVSWCGKSDDGSDGKDETGDVLQEEIEAWVEVLRDWEGDIRDTAGAIWDLNLDSDEMYNIVNNTKDVIVSLRTDLEDISEHIDAFTDVYRNLLIDENDGDDTDPIDFVNDYKRTAIYSWEQLYQNGSARWHHALVFVSEMPSKIPTLDYSTPGLKICIELEDHSGAVRVDVAKYDPGSSSIYLGNRGKGKDKDKFRLWTFGHTYDTEENHYINFDAYDQANAQGDKDGCINETEAYTLEDDASGVTTVTLDEGQVELHNRRVSLLEQAGVKSYARALYSYHPDDGETINQLTWRDDFDEDGDLEDAPYGGLAFIIEADGYREQFE